MYKFAILFALVLPILFSNYAHGQEPQLATFQEISQVIVDKRLSNNVTASITLQSSSNQEIRIPSELEKKILSYDQLVAVVVTNEERCILGVEFESCIMVNISREGIEGGIIAIQDRAKEIGDELIDDINEALDTDAEFHSVFVHFEDPTNVALETSGVVSGRGTVSAVYTMPREDTASMYQKITAILLPQVIRDSGGFYDVANDLATEQKARMTISMIPQDELILYQIKMSVDYPNKADPLERIDPMQFLKTESLKRSDYFSQGFYPLNSLFQLVVLTSEPVKVKEVNSPIIPNVVRNGEKFPSDITKKGWSLVSESGDKIEAMYLFGKDFDVTRNEMILSIGSSDDTEPIKENIPDAEPFEFDMQQALIVGGIIVAAAVAIVFYLKGFRAKR